MAGSTCTQNKKPNFPNTFLGDPEEHQSTTTRTPFKDYLTCEIIFFHDVAGNDGGNDGGDDNDDDSHSDDDTNDEEQWLLLHQQNYQLGLGGSYGLFLARGL